MSSPHPNSWFIAAQFTHIVHENQAAGKPVHSSMPSGTTKHFRGMSSGAIAIIQDAILGDTPRKMSQILRGNHSSLLFESWRALTKRGIVLSGGEEGNNCERHARLAKRRIVFRALRVRWDSHETPALRPVVEPGRIRMKKLLRCCDVIPGCDFIAHGVNENEIIIRKTQHARTAHNVAWLTSDLLRRVLAAIRDDEPAVVEG